jgi:hypothetical protein
MNKSRYSNRYENRKWFYETKYKIKIKIKNPSTTEVQESTIFSMGIMGTPDMGTNKEENQIPHRNLLSETPL